MVNITKGYYKYLQKVSFLYKYPCYRGVLVIGGLCLMELSVKRALTAINDNNRYMESQKSVPCVNKNKSGNFYFCGEN